MARKKFTLKSGNRSTFKMMGSSSPMHNDKKKKESMRDRDVRLLKEYADRDKEGGIGLVNPTEEDVKNLKLARHRSRVSDIKEMSKAELLEASGKKDNAWNKLTISKGKLKDKLKRDAQWDLYHAGGGSRQVEQSNIRYDDEYTGVSE